MQFTTKIESTATKLSYFYPGFAKDPNGKDCTLGNLSAMESGLDWDENYANPFKPNAKAYYGDDLADFMLKRKFKAVSGTQFEYQSGTTQLLGFAVRKAIGESLSSYASEKLWRPLGMEYSAFWNLDRENGMEKPIAVLMQHQGILQNSDNYFLITVYIMGSSF